MRADNIWVLPVPGPAMTITGPSVWSTAFFCWSLRRAYSSSNFFRSLSLAMDIVQR